MKTKTLKLMMVALGVLLSINANADTYNLLIDGIYYRTNTFTRTATVVAGDEKYTGEVIIPESIEFVGGTYSITTIDWKAFYECNQLTSVSIPNSVTSIGKNVFSGCNSLKAVHITDLAAWCKISFGDNPLYSAHHLYLNGKEVKDLIIPQSVTSISESAFSGCSGLTSVTIPNSVTSIGDGAFSNCI